MSNVSLKIYFPEKKLYKLLQVCKEILNDSFLENKKSKTPSNLFIKSTNAIPRTMVSYITRHGSTQKRQWESMDLSLEISWKLGRSIASSKSG